MGLTALTPGGSPQDLRGTIQEHIKDVNVTQNQIIDDLIIGGDRVLRLNPGAGVTGVTLNGVVSNSIDSRPLTIMGGSGLTITIAALAGTSLAVNQFALGTTIVGLSGETFQWSKQSGNWVPTSQAAVAAPGTVTSVGTGSGLTGGPIVAAGTISLANQPAHTFMANITGAPAPPTGVTDAQAYAELGVLPAANFPALTGDVTTVAGALAATISAGAVTLAKQANLAANSFQGNNTGAPATPLALTVAQSKTLLAITLTSDVTGTLQAAQMPALTGPVTTAGGTLATAINLSGGSITNTLPAANFPALTGDVTTTGASLATTIAAGAVTLAKQANLAANSIIGNNTGGAATPIALTIAQAQSLLTVPAVTKSQLFTGSGTYTPTTGAIMTEVYVCGGGGGGGGGAKNTATVPGSGGGGGGAGALYRLLFKTSDVNTQTVTVGAGGAAGIAATVNTTAGGNGGNGGQTSFGAILLAGGGGGGLGGQVASTASTGGGGGSANQTGANGSAGGAGAFGSLNNGGTGAIGLDVAIPNFGSGGGGCGTTGVSFRGGNSYGYGPCGGGSGGGIGAANASNNGAPGGNIQLSNSVSNGGTSGTPNGSGGPFVNGYMGGGGGGGGYGNGAGNAGNGGAGNQGGGGGGGGSCNNANTSGTGGAGGGGFVFIVEYF
jgi:hypothetical protein